MACVLVTPELAAKWLERNIEDNRNLNRATDEMYARLMKEGKWHLTPDYIAFNDKGELFNGQNRLTAVVMAGVNVLMNVDFGGYGDESMAATDQGMTRSATDIAKILGHDEVYRSHVAQAFVRNFGQIKFGWSRKDKISRTEIIEMIGKYYNVCRYVYDLTKGKKAKNSVFAISAVAAIINGEDRELVESFLDEISGNINENVHRKVNHNAAMEAKNALYYNNYRTSMYSGGGHNVTTQYMVYDCQKYIFKYVRGRMKVKKGMVDIYPVTEDQLAGFNAMLHEESGNEVS